MSFREFEVRKKPLFSSMKRAKEALSKEHNTPCNFNSFFNYMEKLYGPSSENIDYVTFYDYPWIENGVNTARYTIAYIYTKPNFSFREEIFNDRELITSKTGWYPMISGNRANFTKVGKTEGETYWNLLKRRIPYVHLGKPISIRNVACDISSTALLLKCSKGCILLDTGFEVEDEIVDEVNFIFISHYHRDHSGGLFSFLRKREVPVILSDITLEYGIMSM